MHTLIRTLIGLHVPFLISGNASAQQPEVPKTREGKAEFALVTTSGNASSQTIGAAAEITFRPTNWVIEGQTAFVRNESEDVVSAKSFTVRGRVSRVLTPRLHFFVQQAYLRDLFAGIEHRNSTVGGLSFLVFETSRHTFSTDAGLGYLNEQRRVDESLSTATATGGARYVLKLSETSDITDELLMSFDSSNDGTWRGTNALALTARVTAALSLKISNIVRYVNEPVLGFEQTDSTTSAALVLSF